MRAPTARSWRRSTQEERTVSYAAAQMDFYHAVYLTGCILFALGLMVALMAFIGAIRRDAREAVKNRERRPFTAI